MTPVQYRQFAADCGRWACRAKDTTQRDTLLALTYVWEDAAVREEKLIRHEIDKNTIKPLGPGLS
jgi:hypothetical protein